MQVNQSTPTIAWTQPAAIPFGTALSATQLNAAATLNVVTVPRNLRGYPAAGAIPPAGTDTLSVTFTPTDTTDIKSVITTTPIVVVTQAAPVITWAHAGCHYLRHLA